MSVQTSTVKTPSKKKKPSHGTGRGYGAKTILFNDDVHTFDEVAHALVKATHCSYTNGLSSAAKVHNQGSAVVYTGHLERCEAVAMVLGGFGLRADVAR